MKYPCQLLLPIQWSEFIGCNGQPVSNELIELWIDRVVKDERYEAAARYKKELDRRKKETD